MYEHTAGGQPNVSRSGNAGSLQAYRASHNASRRRFTGNTATAISELRRVCERCRLSDNYTGLQEAGLCAGFSVAPLSVDTPRRTRLILFESSIYADCPWFQDSIQRVIDRGRHSISFTHADHRPGQSFQLHRPTLCKVLGQ